MTTRLQELRKAKDLTQKELAEKVGMSLATLRQYEIGFRSINGASALTVWRLAQVLECNIEDILELKVPIFWAHEDEEIQGYAEFDGETICFYEGENIYEVYNISGTPNIIPVWNKLLSRRGEDGRVDETYVEETMI